MKSVLISIRPIWCELIAQGKKTLEVRKTRPKIEAPFKVYIYCTKEKSSTRFKGQYCGKVIGEFICDNIRRFDVPYPAFQKELDGEILKAACVTYYMLHRYAYHDDLYGWHISNLKIYDNPLPLNSFICCCPNYFSACNLCDFIKRGADGFSVCENRVQRPPQSWRYIEEGARL
jgi:predicted transcriptional regulator